MSDCRLVSGTAGLLDLFRQTPRAKVALHAKALRDGQGVGAGGVWHGAAAPQGGRPVKREGAAVQGRVIGEYGVVGVHGGPMLARVAGLSKGEGAWEGRGKSEGRREWSGERGREPPWTLPQNFIKQTAHGSLP